MSDILLGDDAGGLITLDDGSAISLGKASIPVPAGVVHGVGDYAAVILALLPPGRVWPREAGAVLPQVVAGLAPSPARLEARAAALLQDAPAGTLNELLPEWEATLGLPDPCAGPNPSIDFRRRQVSARIEGQGGQSVPYYIAFAQALGWTITIDEFTPRKHGAPHGDRYYGADWASAWRVNIYSLPARKRHHGDPHGERYATWGDDVIQCELRRIAPAHTTLFFQLIPYT